MLVGDHPAGRVTRGRIDLGALLAAGLMPVSVDVRRPDLDDLYRALKTVDA